MALNLSPKCNNTSFGYSCGYCGSCGREFKYFNREDGQPILYIVKPSEKDLLKIIEQCQQNQSLMDLAPSFCLINSPLAELNI